MGTNDHTPNKGQRNPSRRRGAPKELLDWSMADPMQLFALASAVSMAGGYLGLGRNADADCLLLYVKLDDWKERVAIEKRDDISPTLAELLAEF